MKLAIIGGSLLGELNDLTDVVEERIKTPFGEPSDNYVTGRLGDTEVVYINRHGRLHHIAPHQIKKSRRGIPISGLSTNGWSAASKP